MKPKTSKEVLMYNRSSGEITSTPLTNIGGGSSISMSMYRATQVGAGWPLTSTYRDMQWALLSSSGNTNLAAQGVTFGNLNSPIPIHCYVSGTFTFGTQADQSQIIRVEKFTATSQTSSWITSTSTSFTTRNSWISVSLSFYVSLNINDSFFFKVANHGGHSSTVLVDDGFNATRITIIETK